MAYIPTGRRREGEEGPDGDEVGTEEEDQDEDEEEEEEVVVEPELDLLFIS